MVPPEVSVKRTVSGLLPLVGVAEKTAIGGMISPQQVREKSEILSRYQPRPEKELSEPQRQRSWMVWPEAPAGKTAVVVMKPPESPLQALRPPSGFP